MAGPALAETDIENGKSLAYTCYGCHGIPGYKNAYPSYSVPKIAGQNYEYLVTALLQYRNGERPHGTMRAQAEGYTEQELRDIAAYLASLGEENR
ncbi:MAG: c-type cytochrome [Lysobacteraceae bacterium]